jgi:hypothetical protein
VPFKKSEALVPFLASMTLPASTSCKEKTAKALQQQTEARNEDDVVQLERLWGPTWGPWGPLPRVGKDEVAPICLIFTSNALFESEGAQFGHDHFRLGAMRKFFQEGQLFPPGTRAMDLVGTVEAAKFVFLARFHRHRIFKLTAKDVGRSFSAKISNILSQKRAKRLLITGIINQRIFDVKAGQEHHCCAVLPNAIIDVNLGRRPRSPKVLREIFQDISSVYGIID